MLLFLFGFFIFIYGRHLHGFGINVSTNSVTPAPVTLHYCEGSMLQNGALRNIHAL